MLLIHFVAAAQKLKTQFTTSFSVSIFQVRQIPFSANLQVLTDQLLRKSKTKLFKLSFMIIKEVLYKKK